MVGYFEFMRFQGPSQVLNRTYYFKQPEFCARGPVTGLFGITFPHLAEFL
jgi:hypothetical protein